MARAEKQHSRVHPTPVLKTTPYETVSSGLMSATIGLLTACVCLSAIWYINRPAKTLEAVPVEMIELAGGDEQGMIDETLNLESPEEETADPSLAEVEDDISEVEELLETVVDQADQLANPIDEQLQQDVTNRGKPGSASGTGQRALGIGPGEAGLPREQRWFVTFSDRVSIEEYARQLEFFGIELGALLSDGRLALLSKMATQPSIRYVESGDGENRLYMNWQGGARKLADLELFKQAGLSVPSQTTVLHFYPERSESLLARAERNYAGVTVERIRRTYFVVQRNQAGYTFNVVRQILFSDGPFGGR